MSAVLAAKEPRAEYLAAAQPQLIRHFELLGRSKGDISRLRELILMLAVQGKLVPQLPSDEPAGMLLRRIERAKEQLVAAGAIKRPKPQAHIPEDGLPFPAPIGWQWVRLSTLLQKIGAGSTPLGGKEVYVTSGVKFLRSQNVWNDGLRLDGVAYINPATHAKMAGTVVVANDLLFNITGASIGRCAAVPDDFDEANVSQHVTIIRPILPALKAFLHTVLISPLVQQAVMDVQVGVSREGLSIAKLSSFLVPVPPLQEQARIVARVGELIRLCDALEARDRLGAEQHARLFDVLLGSLTDSGTPEELAANWQLVADHFDRLLDRPEAVDALERTILQLAVRGQLVPQLAADVPAHELSAEIQRLRRSRRKITLPDSDAITEAGIELPNGWSWCSVDQVSADDETAITDGPFGANLKTEHYVESEGFRVIRLQNIGAGVFRDEHRAYVDEGRYNRLLRHAAFPGDIVVAGLVDDSIRCCIVPDGVGPAIVKADCYRFAVHESVDAQYVCLYLCSETAHRFASAHHHGLTLTRIGLGNFRSIPVPLPPASEQRRIVARVNELRRLCTELRQRLDRGRATQAAFADALIDRALAAA